MIVVLTPYYQSLLPVDLRLGKMLVLGSLFQCLDPILTVAACLSSKPLFSSPMEKRDEAAKYETTKLIPRLWLMSEIGHAHSS